MLRHYICQHCSTPFSDPSTRVRKFCTWQCAAAVNAGRANLQHGSCRRSAQAPEWIAWRAIRARCLNTTHPAYPGYGGRGVTICDAWRDSFERFLADVGKRPSAEHSIDRVDNNLGYTPGNVVWSTRTEQGRNKRNNRLLTLGDTTRCLSEWSDVLGIDPTTLARRIKLGWSVERTLTTPLRGRIA